MTVGAISSFAFGGTPDLVALNRPLPVPVLAPLPLCYLYAVL
jgi:hypothetical protein